MNSAEYASSLDPDYEAIVAPLLAHDDVRSMHSFRHHDRTALTHSLSVSTLAFSIARRLGLDSVSVARGALLHDFFLYDRRADKTPFHLNRHAKVALRNARARFRLNLVEQDIILAHMWPVGRPFYTYRESALVSFVDKFVSTREVTMMVLRSILSRFTTLAARLSPVST